MFLKDWNLSQYQAAGRHIASYAAGGITALIAFHIITPGQGQEITENIGLISDGLTKLVAGIGGLITTFVSIRAAFIAAKSASPSEQVKAVVENLSAPQITQAANAVADPSSRNKIIEAVAAMPEVKTIITSPEVAHATPSSPNVVSTGT